MRNLADEADAVVIGAGAFGLSAAYHLAALGVGRVVVVDQFAPGSQTSPRAAGLFKLVQADETRTRLARLSIQKVTHFKAETGVPLAVQRSGSLLLARTAAHAEMILAEAARSRGWGVDLEVVDAREATRLAPYLEPDGILAAVHIPGDVYVEEPAWMLQAYLQAGERRGVTVLGDTRVSGIRVREGAVEGVATEHHSIRAPLVVDAAGPWARGVARMAGARVPVVPMRHQLRISRPIPGISPGEPILRIVDTAVYIRPARAGLMFGGFEQDPLPFDPSAQRAGFSADHVPLDMRVLDRLHATVDQQVPVLREAGLNEHRGGLFTMTQDGRFIVGPVPEVRGLWAATGCNGSGFSFSPALGQLLAEWIVDGAPSIDISSLAPGRFGEPLDEDALQAAAVWQYANYYTPDSAA